MPDAVSHQAFPATAPPGGFDDAVWADVLRAVDRTYAELVSYQDQLESQNEKLEALRRFLGSVLASVSDALIVLDRNGTVAEASQSLDTLLAVGKAGALGQPFAALVAEGSRGRAAVAIESVLRSRTPTTVEVELTSPSGPEPFELSIAARVDQRGKPQGVVLTGRPLGELRRTYAELEQSHRALKEAQAQLVRNEKLASLGRLLAGVAHELNNPISFVYANTHALEKYAQRFETYFDRVQAGASREELIALREELRLDRDLRNLRSAIDGARDGAERVRDIVEDLRRLSAEGTGETVDFDLLETARIAANWVQRGTKRAVSLSLHGDGKVSALGRPGHVQQVVMNLVQNAMDALADTPDPRIDIHAFHRDGLAVLQVTDNGPGIPAELQASVFDPFFTTKDVGKGTGLGLSISHKIAEEHGGSLRLCDEQGQGACFRLELPQGTGR